MKQTCVERNGRAQLIRGVGPTAAESRRPVGALTNGSAGQAASEVSGGIGSGAVGPVVDRDSRPVSVCRVRGRDTSLAEDREVGHRGWCHARALTASWALGG